MSAGIRRRNPLPIRSFLLEWREADRQRCLGRILPCEGKPWEIELSRLVLFTLYEGDIRVRAITAEGLGALFNQYA